MELINVIIPIYKTDLSCYEILSLKRTFEVLQKHVFVIIYPEGLDISTIKKLADNCEIRSEAFHPNFFEGIDGYNKLMLSAEFYERFNYVKYILICQTDVYVFRDELDYWCSKEYDYIGGPWMVRSNSKLSMMINHFNDFIRQLKGRKKRHWDHMFKVGNGGFSLRNTQTFRCITTNFVSEIEYYLTHSADHYGVEDVFWGLKAPLLYPQMKIPQYLEALKFAFDRKHKYSMKYNKGNLPSAVHGFSKQDALEFWSGYIPDLKQIYNCETAAKRI